MNISLILVGKTDLEYIKNGIEIFVGRLSHYINFDIKVITDIKNKKNLSLENQKNEEGVLIIKNLNKDDFIVLLDENGTTYSSELFAEYINSKMISGIKRLVFIVGGPYGFSNEVYKIANQKISLSKMTFSHQMVRLIFIEQLYRAFTILNNEPYHHK
jgi:23S rRNA (pseudouridine1915-N3)-methyltransferase